MLVEFTLAKTTPGEYGMISKRGRDLSDTEIVECPVCQSMNFHINAELAWVQLMCANYECGYTLIRDTKEMRESFTFFYNCLDYSATRRAMPMFGLTSAELLTLMKYRDKKAAEKRLSR